MTYFRDRWQGAGAIAANDRAPRSAPGIHVGPLDGFGPMSHITEVAKKVALQHGTHSGGFGSSKGGFTSQPTTTPQPGGGGGGMGTHADVEAALGKGKHGGGHGGSGKFGTGGHQTSPLPFVPAPGPMPGDGSGAPLQVTYVCWDGSRSASAEGCPPVQTATPVLEPPTGVPMWAWVAGGVGLAGVAYLLFGRKKKQP